MTKQLSNHAAAAKLIRAELKKHGIKGKVRTRSYAGGSSIDIDVIDQLPATVRQIEEFAGQFEYGHFDGMTDCYEYSNIRNDIPQVSFVFVRNEWSEEKKADAWNYVRGWHADASDTDEPQTMDDFELLYRVMRGTWGTWITTQKPRVAA